MEMMFITLALVAEALQLNAYIVPTGQMAPTILGYHKIVTCPKCKSQFALNASREADDHPAPEKVTGCECSFCQTPIRFGAKDAPASRGGDRILAVGVNPQSLRRHDVLLFQYPPNWFQPEREESIWMSRLVGLPGETVAIVGGRVFVSRDLKYKDDKVPANEIWAAAYMHRDDPAAIKIFEQGQFQVARKPPELLLAQRALVHDHGFRDPQQPVRWAGDKDTAWTAGKGDTLEHPGKNADIDWLAYQHYRRVEKGAPKPRLILDHLPFNQFHTKDHEFGTEASWAGDLMIECDVAVAKSAGELWFDLARAGRRFQARFDLATGKCSVLLVRKGVAKEIAAAQTTLKTAGTFHVRFANCQGCLTVWVDDKKPFGDCVGYAGSIQAGPTVEDLTPARIGSLNASLRIGRLQIWRDVSYSHSGGRADVPIEDDADPTKWEALQKMPIHTFYVQAKHYFVIGDNPMSSSDSREWGVVPESLLRGKAVVGYFPAARVRSIR